MSVPKKFGFSENFCDIEQDSITKTLDIRLKKKFNVEGCH